MFTKNKTNTDIIETVNEKDFLDRFIGDHPRTVASVETVFDGVFGAGKMIGKAAKFIAKPAIKVRDTYRGNLAFAKKHYTR